MDNVPDEILLYILSFLDVNDLVSLQRVSRRLLSLARDKALWRTICYDASYTASRRRRREKDRADGSSVTNDALIRALAGLINPVSPSPTSINNGSNPIRPDEPASQGDRRRERAVADWDPSYPRERIDFYSEYLQRHAPVSTSWFETATSNIGAGNEGAEITGVGLFQDAESSKAMKIYAALDDGSIGVWDMLGITVSGDQGRLVGRSSHGLLAGQRRDSLNLDVIRTIMTASAAIECVSLDHSQEKGFFAVQDRVCQVDLATLQMISSEAFGDAITSISEARHPLPITVGTMAKVHLYDYRQKSASVLDHTASARLELIGGCPSWSDLYTTQLNERHFRRNMMNHQRSPMLPAVLSESGPSSIVHGNASCGSDMDDSSIWVAGRFTSILNYDRRFFPKLKGSIHSGARISCIRHQPYPFRSRPWNATGDGCDFIERQRAKASPGNTLLAVGEYKGKGSLELYGLNDDPRCEVMSSRYMKHDADTERIAFRNRQTASGTKILSATSHGGKYVYSDGDGNVKWIERDGFTPIRTWNINDESDVLAGAQHQDISRSTRRSPSSSASLQSEEILEHPEDLVKLLLPTMPNSTRASDSRACIGEDNLVIWTGEGKIGLLGFGNRPRWCLDNVEEQAEQYADVHSQKKEREYTGLMGKALRRQQDEINFMRSFGFQ